MEEGRKKIVTGKSREKRLLGRLRHRLEDDIIAYLKEIGVNGRIRLLELGIGIIRVPL